MNPQPVRTRTLRRVAPLVLLLLSTASCSSTKDNGSSCRTVANCTIDTAPICDAASLMCRACTMGADDIACKNGRPSTPRCGPQGSCVACLNHGDCATKDLRKPACHNFACGPCKSATECQSKLCSADGSCAPVAEVLYVDNKNGSCTGIDHKGSIDDPFCTLRDAVTAATMGGKTLISVAPSSKPYAALSVSPADQLTSLQIVGSGTLPSETRIEGLLNESAIAVMGDGTMGKPTVQLRNLELRGGSSASASGVSCTQGGAVTMSNIRVRGSGGSGISASNCNIVADQSHVFDNRASGISLTSSTFALSNLMLWSNSVSGISLGVGNSGTMRFLTLSVNGNPASAQPAGIDCGATAHLVEHSIVFDNYSRASGINSTDNQLVGCMLTNVVTNDKQATGGIYKTALDFVNPVADVSNIDLHLVKDSPKNRDACVDKVAQPPSDHDIDGTARPQGSAADIGAHEVQ